MTSHNEAKEQLRAAIGKLGEAYRKLDRLDNWTGNPFVWRCICKEVNEDIAAATHATELAQELIE